MARRPFCEHPRKGLRATQRIRPPDFGAFPDALCPNASSLPFEWLGPSPETNQLSQETRGELMVASHVHKWPNSPCSNFAVLNGRNSGGVLDCIYYHDITHTTSVSLLPSGSSFCRNNKVKALLQLAHTIQRFDIITFKLNFAFLAMGAYISAFMECALTHSVILTKAIF